MMLSLLSSIFYSAFFLNCANIFSSFVEWFDAADKMLLEECKNFDVIITTALIPGRKAPVLIKKHHVEAMPSGGVTIDLAAASGGNVETTVAGGLINVLHIFTKIVLIKILTNPSILDSSMVLQARW